MLALGTALGNLSLVVLHNAGVARAEAAARLKASDDCWRRLSAAHVRYVSNVSLVLSLPEAPRYSIVGPELVRPPPYSSAPEQRTDVLAMRA